MTEIIILFFKNNVKALIFINKKQEVSQKCYKICSFPFAQRSRENVFLFRSRRWDEKILIAL